MTTERVYDLKNEEKTIEARLLELAKKESLNEIEQKEMIKLRDDLKRISNEINTIKHEINNWTCSYSFKSVNGNIEKTFEVNGKEVDEKEYKAFISKKSLDNRRKRHVHLRSPGGHKIDIFNDDDDDDDFGDRFFWKNFWI